MEEIIKPNDYVRTHNGRIYKVTNAYILKITCGHTSLRYSEITKHSKNIMDLIECGDIVETFDVLHNDVVYIWNEEMLKALKEDIENGIQIKSIVTYESFNSIKYEVI